MKRRFYKGYDFRRARSIEEMRLIARRRTPNFCFEYVEGGADDERTLLRNRQVFEEISFLPRTLVDVSRRSQEIELFGKTCPSPFAIGPTGFNGMLTHQGDLKLARAAARAGIPFTLSTVSNTSLEDIADQAGGTLWMQVYMYRTRGFVRDLAERAKRAGYTGLVVTTDVPLYGNREWDLRNFRKPMKLNLRNLLDVPLHLRWLFDVLIPHGMPRFKNLGDLLPPGQDSAQGASAVLGRELDPSLNWDDITWLRDLWHGNLIVKGISTVEDAETAVRHGVDGIVISNHGGRQLDGAVTSMEVLQEIASHVKGRITVMADGGFRRGTDILKAKALGADAVLIGRAAIYGLAAGGEGGASHAIDILRSEIDRGLGLLGCPDIARLDAERLRLRRQHGVLSA